MKRYLFCLSFLLVSSCMVAQSRDDIMDVKGSVGEYVYLNIGSLDSDEIIYQVVSVRDIRSGMTDYYMRYRYVAPLEKSLCIGIYTEADLENVLLLLRHAKDNIIGLEHEHTTQLMYVTETNQSASVYKGVREWKVSFMTDHTHRDTQIDISGKRIQELIQFMEKALDTIDKLKR